MEFFKSGVANLIRKLKLKRKIFKRNVVPRFGNSAIVWETLQKKMQTTLKKFKGKAHILNQELDGYAFVIKNHAIIIFIIFLHKCEISQFHKTVFHVNAKEKRIPFKFLLIFLPN